MPDRTEAKGVLTGPDPPPPPPAALIDDDDGAVNVTVAVHAGVVHIVPVKVVVLVILEFKPLVPRVLSAALPAPPAPTFILNTYVVPTESVRLPRNTPPAPPPPLLP
jgi:hypothetical protein